MSFLFVVMVEDRYYNRRGRELGTVRASNAGELVTAVRDLIVEKEGVSIDEAMEKLRVSNLPFYAVELMEGWRLC